MVTCQHCGANVVSDLILEKHIFKRHKDTLPPVANPEVTGVHIVNTSEETELGTLLHFNKKVEIRVNGISYEGKDITVPKVQAADIIRIARDAYGMEVI